jgi:Ca-activated chloride channel family protein
LPPADAVRVEELINYFPYTYPAPKNGDVFSITRQLTDCPWNDKHQLIRIGIKGKDIEVKNRKTNNLVFLVDVSGSMSSSDKLPLLKSGLRLLVDQMQAEDRITLVAYAGAAGMVLPPTDGKHKEQILEALERLESGGSTAGGAGITLAYKVAREQFLQEGNNRIILATDGDFNVGISSEGELVRLIEKERASGVFLTVLGFGTGNLNDAVMEQLADKGNGNYAYIDNLLEAKKVLVHEMGGTLVTIASDVKIQVEFNPAKVKAYRLVGYENRLLNAEDFNDDKKDAGELGSGHSVTALYEIITTDSDETVPGSDVLKYQTTKSPATLSDEMMTVKFRYKEPGTNSSKLITSVLKDEKISLSEAGDDLQFAAAVAGFGLLLRNSEYKGTANYADIHSLAVKSKGKDEQGYRAEFASLVEIAELLSKRN